MASSVPIAPTIEEIVRIAAKLDSEMALNHVNGNRIRLCCTEVVEAITLADGRVVLLKRIERIVMGSARSCYMAGYVRVSMPKQRSGTTEEKGGYSEDEQIRKIISHALEKGWAFRIFSDAGLSGKLPTNDKDLIDDMRLKEERIYREVFTKVFIEDLEYADRVDRLRAHMDRECNKILAGGFAEGDQSDIEFSRNRSKTRNRPNYRPGLTIMVEHLPEIHTVAVTDLSRLTRNDALFANLLRYFEKYQLDAVGLYEPLPIDGPPPFS